MPGGDDDPRAAAAPPRTPHAKTARDPRAETAHDPHGETARDPHAGTAHDLHADAARQPLGRDARATLEALRRAGLRVATAESCTGGLVAGALTAIAGSSDVVHGGFVTYANEAKSAMLGVDPALIAAVGAVSEDVARAMADGARGRTGADLAVAITGVAGPGGGSVDKPVGTVWFGIAGPRGTRAEHHRLDGDRAAIRNAAVRVALGLLRREAEPPRA